MPFARFTSNNPRISKIRIWILFTSVLIVITKIIIIISLISLLLGHTPSLTKNTYRSYYETVIFQNSMAYE
jgi:hypothetical protein